MSQRQVMWDAPKNSFKYYYRRTMNALMLSFCVLVTLCTLLFLVWLTFSFFIKGLNYFHWSVFTENTPSPNAVGGGLKNAIVGTLMMTGGALLISIPLGVLAGTYLSEYGREAKISSFIHFINDILLSAPSIVIGLFVYNLFVVSTNHFSGWYGAISLAIIAIPVIIRSTDSVMKLVPEDVREAASALGAPRWKITVFIIYRAAGAGIVTGVVLATSRIAGETAPLLFTALGNSFFNMDMTKPMSALSLVIYNFAMSPYSNWQGLAWVGAMLITVLVLIMNIIARSLVHFARTRT